MACGGVGGAGNVFWLHLFYYWLVLQQRGRIVPDSGVECGTFCLLGMLRSTTMIDMIDNGQDEA